MSRSANNYTYFNSAIISSSAPTLHIVLIVVIVCIIHHGNCAAIVKSLITRVHFGEQRVQIVNYNTKYLNKETMRFDQYIISR